MNGCCGFGLRLLRPGLLPGGGDLGLPGHLRDRLRREIGLGCGVVAVALATLPLEQRGSIPHLGPIARQRARPAELSGRQGGLRLHSWGLAVVPPLQALPLPLSTSHSHGSSLCGYPHSHSTEAILAGLSTLRTGGSSNTRRTEARNRSFAACVRSAGSACIA